MHVCIDLTAVFKVAFGGVNIWGAEISELTGVSLQGNKNVMAAANESTHSLSVVETRERVYASPSSLNLHA